MGHILIVTDIGRHISGELLDPTLNLSEQQREMSGCVIRWRKKNWDSMTSEPELALISLDRFLSWLDLATTWHGSIDLATTWYYIESSPYLELLEVLQPQPQQLASLWIHASLVPFPSALRQQPQFVERVVRAQIAQLAPWSPSASVCRSVGIPPLLICPQLQEFC